MACRLLVKNIANSWSTGDVICVTPESQPFGRMESKTKFRETLKEGESIDDWPRQFVIINISDANESELSYLLDDNEDGRRYFLTPQGSDSPYYNQLLESAEITTTKNILLSLVNDRGA